MWRGGKKQKRRQRERGRNGHEESSSEIDATVTELVWARAGYASKQKAISDSDVDKRNLVQVQFGILHSRVHIDFQLSFQLRNRGVNSLNPTMTSIHTFTDRQT